MKGWDINNLIVICICMCIFACLALGLLGYSKYLQVAYLERVEISKIEAAAVAASAAFVAPAATEAPPDGGIGDFE